MSDFVKGFKKAREDKKKGKVAKQKGAEFANEKNYREEAYFADAVYKSFVIDGASRLDKVNGRLLALENMKLDTLIEQNEKIIELLEIIANR